MTYPYDTNLYSVALTSGFATGYTPTLAIIGLNNKVYFDSTQILPETVEDLVARFASALSLAIDEFYRPIYVSNPITDKNYVSDFNENIDLNTVFTEAEANPMTFSIIENTNPEAVTAGIAGNILTISGTCGDIAESSISVQAVSGENSATDIFSVTSYDPASFSYLESGFESTVFPPPFWEIKYNTAADGGLNGTNLIDPPSTPKWQLNDTTTPDYGADYIHSGENSALIKYWAPDFNWLIMPPMQLDYNDYTLSFWTWYSSSSYETKFHVLVNDGTKGWASILDWDAADPDNLYDSEITLPLTDYVGKTIRLAFVYEYSDGFEMALDDIKVESPSGIENNAGMPQNIALYQNYPNPFNPSTKIKFSIPENSQVKLSVYNQKGELVETLYEGLLEKGNHSCDFVGTDITSGIYFYKLETDESSYMGKMIMLK
ncbi:MAG: hypothetical protein A2Y39_05500 [Candidatus Delongbacteria bacterium GWF2_40_14]|nr:MAG: hypothetical protein A2Y39_05500 [Candidatus Delongbacteria bacterium GWF2_40_14]